MSGPAAAQNCGVYPNAACPGVEVDSVSLQPESVRPVAPAAVAAPAAAPALQVKGQQQLPVTGSDLTLIAVLGGVALIGAGTVITRQAKTRTVTQ